MKTIENKKTKETIDLVNKTHIDDVFWEYFSLAKDIYRRVNQIRK